MEFMDLSGDHNYYYDSNQYFAFSENSDKAYQNSLPEQYSSSTKVTPSVQQAQINQQNNSSCNDFSSEDTNDPKNQLNGIKNKKISKKEYEPIVDNSIVYRYEDNPEEYKRIRKKQQNRESATRVRYRKKNHVDQVEFEVLYNLINIFEIKTLKEQNTQLQLINAKLQAENNSLKQQVQFLQNLIQRDYGQQSQQSYSIVNEKSSQNINPSFCEFERVPAQKQHFVFLTIMTTLICILLVQNQGNDDQSVAYESIILALQRNEDIDRNITIKSQVDQIIWNNNIVKNLKSIGIFTVAGIYFGYVVYFVYQTYIKKIFSLKVKNL